MPKGVWTRTAAYRQRLSEAQTNRGKSFWDKVDKRGHAECWAWIGGRSTGGYGVHHGRAAHRLSWTMQNGPIPEGMNVLHRCDNPPCVNPAHLFLGTKKDNSADMVAKGRWGGKTLRGEDCPTAKLRERDVREIRRRHAAGESAYSLARAFGIAGSTARAIVNRQSWTHLS